MAESLVLDVDRIRKEARQTMAAGPMTGHYGVDADRVISVLHDVVATEVVGWLRSTRYMIATQRLDRPAVSTHFADHADQEMRHAVAVAERIAELGGQPNFDSATLAQRAQTDYALPDEATLRQVLEQTLAATRIVISGYREIAEWLGGHDPATRRLIESLSADEETNEARLAALLDG